MNLTASADIDPKRARVLEGATRVFLNYGFARTTMDDIAKAAEMSRPALYLLFRNKTDIFRAIATSMLEGTIETTRRVLSEDGPFVERFMAAIDGSFIAMMQLIAGSAHGAELLDMKNSIACDLAFSWRDEMRSLIAAAIGREAKTRGVDLAAQQLSAEGLADLVLDGIEGIKSRLSTPDEQREAARGLVRTIDLVLRP